MLRNVIRISYIGLVSRLVAGGGSSLDIANTYGSLLDSNQLLIRVYEILLRL